PHYLSYSCMLYSITPPPPTLTLFPYTTLFRSGASKEAGRRRASVSLSDRHGSHRPSDRALPDQRAGRRGPPRRPGPSGRRGGPRDRKSTRLNSSHVAISYAVFCWKKKRK